MKMRKLLIIMLVLCSICFCSCKSKDTQEPEKTKICVKKISKYGTSYENLETKYIAEYECDEDGREIANYSYSVNGESKILTEKYLTEYDEKGNETKYSYYYYDGETGELLGYDITTLEYNDHNDITKDYYANYTKDGSIYLERTHMYGYEYDEAGNVVVETYSNSDYAGIDKHTFTYDSLNRVLTDISLEKNGTEDFEYISKEEYVYTGSNLTPTRVSMSNYDEVEGFVEYAYTSYEFNSKGYVTKQETYFNDVLATQQIYEYSDYGYTFYNYRNDDGLLLNSKCTYEFKDLYDGETDIDNLVCATYDSFIALNPTTFIPSSRQVTKNTFDSDGYMTSTASESYEFEDDNPVLSSVSVIEYVYEETSLDNESNSNKSSKTGLIIGLSLGGVALAVGAANIVIFVLRKKA